MMQKKFLVAIWLLQDLLQVLFLGFCLVPNLYLTYLLLITTLDFSNDELSSKALVYAFIGGVLYDLRWTNVPGASALSWCLALTIASAIWGYMPQNVRHYISYFLLVFFILLFSELVHFVFFAVSSIVMLRQLLPNVVLTMIVAFISGVMFMRKQSSDF